MSGGNFNILDRKRTIDVVPNEANDRVSMTVSTGDKKLETFLTTNEAIYLSHLLLDVAVSINRPD